MKFIQTLYEIIQFSRFFVNDVRWTAFCLYFETYYNAEKMGNMQKVTVKCLFL